MTFVAVLRKMGRCSVFDLLEITRDSEWNALNSEANDEPFGYLAGNPGSCNICAVLDRMQKGCHRRHSIHVPDASRSRHERTGQMSQVWHGPRKEKLIAILAAAPDETPSGAATFFAQSYLQLVHV
jgi:hypothetical protein